MYLVVFRATLAAADSGYHQRATELRERALSEFGCCAFHAVCEGDTEIALSYWPDLASVQRWKEDLAHQSAQRNGQLRWYSRYQVDVTEVVRSYRFGCEQESV